MRPFFISSRPSPACALLLGLFAAGTASAAATATPHEYHDDEIIVTSRRPVQPLITDLAPGKARLAVPAADGAGVLKAVPGFSVIRKGGVSGDPLLRGLGGSRLNILADGGNVYGGCGGRMDPPTAYLYPDSYDKVRIVKGPQTVTEGPGIITGVVSFERKPMKFDAPGLRFTGEALYGSAARNDQAADLAVGNAFGYLRFIGTRSQAGDYRDGDGHSVHSAYRRESGTFIAGLTPDTTTRIEATVDVGRGQAAYADRGMDGVRFDRTAYGLRIEKKALTDWLSKLSLQFNRSHADHVMDNFSLRPAPAMKMLGNPDRTTDTLRLSADLYPTEALSLTLGADMQRDRHTARGGVDYRQRPRVPDQSFFSYGAFAEGRYQVTPKGEIIAGLRHDEQRATFETMPSSAPGRERRYGIDAAFARYEHRWSNAVTLYGGVGRASRAPDYWERNRNPALHPETNTQLDAGWLYSSGAWRANVSLFASQIDDFILIDNRSAAKARNIRARRYGMEAEASWQFARHWKAGAGVSLVHGDNLTDGIPLAQTPPAEGYLTLAYDDGTHAAAVRVRGAMAQHRTAPMQGNIAGVDIGPAPGFVTVSLNGGWRINKHVTLSAGIDNLLNKTYAESVNRAGASVPGYPVTRRVNEPGRTFWLKGKITF